MSEIRVFRHVEGPWTVVQLNGHGVHAMLRRMADEIPQDVRYVHVGRLRPHPEGGDRVLSFTAHYMPASQST